MITNRWYTGNPFCKAITWWRLLVFFGSLLPESVKSRPLPTEVLLGKSNYLCKIANGTLLNTSDSADGKCGDTSPSKKDIDLMFLPSLKKSEFS